MDVVGDNETYEEDSALDFDDDHPVPFFSVRKIVVLSRVMIGRDPLVPEFVDLCHSHRAIVDGGYSDAVVPDPSGCTIIWKTLLFPTLDEMKIWLQEYSIVHNHSYRVLSYFKKRRHFGRGWRVCARIIKVDQWGIMSDKQPHLCAIAEAKDSSL